MTSYNIGDSEEIILKKLENNDFNIEEYKMYAGDNSNNYMDLEGPFHN